MSHSYNGPRCRFCDHRVAEYGSLCLACDAVTERDDLGRPIADGTTALIQSDTQALRDRQEALDG